MVVSAFPRPSSAVGRHAAARPRPPRARRLVVLLATLVAAAAVLVPEAVSAQTSARPTVTRLSVHSGGTWGDDLVTVHGTGFTGSGSRRVVDVRFGGFTHNDFTIVNATTLQVWSPEVPNRRTATHVQVVLRDRTTSRTHPVDVFTFVVPTMDTRLNGGWSANTSRAIADRMIGRAAGLNARAVAPNAGHWTLAMGRSAVGRAAGWLGMPYTWAGGTDTGPSAGVCYGDGLIGAFDCTFRGFDCSGLTLYAWAKYEHLAHYTGTQITQAGSFHPTLSELQPGDLLFFSGGGPVPTHVVMYTGKGRIIQAPESGFGVRYNSLAQLLSWETRYIGATRPMSRGTQGAAPTVASVSTTRSPTKGGATVTLRGSHFDTASQVFFGGSSTYRFSVRSPNVLTVTVPAHAAGTVSVRVANAWGESRSNSRASMRYIAAPSITSLSAHSATTTGGGTIVLTGKNFVPGTQVFFGGARSSSVGVVSSTRLGVRVPHHGAGKVSVTVKTPYGTSRTTTFTFVTPTPTASSPPPPATTAPPTTAAPAATTAAATTAVPATTAAAVTTAG